VHSTAETGSDGDDPDEDASGVAVDADRVTLPFVDGGATSLRCPTY